MHTKDSLTAPCVAGNDTKPHFKIIRKNSMNKKQFLLLSLLACTLLPQADTEASASKLRAVATKSLTFASLLIGSYIGTGIIIGYNNQNCPDFDEEDLAKLSEKERIVTINHLKHLREHPYEAAYGELNEIIMDDSTRAGKALADKATALGEATKEAYATLKEVTKDTYATLAAAAKKFYNKSKGSDSVKTVSSADDTNNKE